MLRHRDALKAPRLPAWLLVAAFLAACSSRPPMRPPNEISEPVFYRLDYLAAEALAGGAFTRDTSGGSLEPGVLFEPRVTFEKNLSPRVGFSFWPLYWNLLLTGDQYDAGGSPEVGKLNVTAHGGMNGIGYSSRDGWVLSAGAGLRGKYLLNEQVFLRANLLFGLTDFTALGNSLAKLETGLGYQATPIHSLLVSHALTHHRAEATRYFHHHGVRHFDGDLNHELRLGHKAYLTPSHVVGPEIGYGFRNHEVGSAGYFLVGLKYRYVIE